MENKKINSLMETLGLSPRDMVIEWAKSGKIDLKSILKEIENTKNAENYVSSFDEIEVGMFLYETGKISSTYSADKCCALILNVNIENREMLMMSTKKAVMPFCSSGFEIDTLGLFKGINATHFIAQIAQDTQDGIAHAAQYCLEYSNPFIKGGNAYLMTEDEFHELGKNMDKVTAAMKMASISEGGFWLSTTAGVDDVTKTSIAKVGILMADRISVHKEVGTIPLSVYPVFSVFASELELD